MKGAQAHVGNPAIETVRTARSGLEGGLVERRFRWAELPMVRRVAAGFGVFLDIGATRLADLVLAVSETAACAVGQGAASAVLRLWQDGTTVCCEVRGEPASVLRTARSIVIGASFGPSIDMRIDNLVAGTGFEPVTFRL